MLLSNFEYIPLRFVRKFLFRDTFLAKFGKFIPYYKMNQGQLNPAPIVDAYWQFCLEAGLDPTETNIMETGIGTTNGTGYEMIARWNGFYWGYEPNRLFDARADHELLRDVCRRYERRDKNIGPQVERVSSTQRIPDQSIDLIFSYSVLEHVKDMPKLCDELKRLLKPKGHMIHIVDYRDHFFKYPFHFLQFSEKVWNTFLDSGDLPRYRLGDHIGAFKAVGLSIEVIRKELNRPEYQKIETHLANRFQYDPDATVPVTSAVLHVFNKVT